MITTISKVSLDEIFKFIGKQYVYMHYDETDSLRHVTCEKDYNDVKNGLMKKYGDVVIIVDNDASFWSDVVTIKNEAWENDYKAYCSSKAEHCAKYGSN